jgi:hypothetical protein
MAWPCHSSERHPGTPADWSLQTARHFRIFFSQAENKQLDTFVFFLALAAKNTTFQFKTQKQQTKTFKYFKCAPNRTIVLN